MIEKKCARATLFALLLTAAVSAQTPAATDQQAPAPAPAADAAAGQPAPAPAPAPTAWRLGGVDVSGMVDAYYSIGLNHPSNNISGLRNFDDHANQLELNMASLTLDYGPKPVGFHIDVGAGRTFDTISATEKDAYDMRFFKQAYVSVKPASWKGVEMDFGRFVTFASAEVIETPNNFNYSRSLLFVWCTPYYHFGFRTTAPIGKHFNSGFELVAGWNNIVTGATYKTVGLTGAWSPSSKITWTNTYYGGPDENKADRGLRNLYDTVLLLNPNGKTSIYLNFDYLHDAPKFGQAWKTYGIAGAVKYQLTKKLAVSPRLEWMNDANGGATGTIQKVKEVTMTGTYSLMDRLSAWMEFRNDWSDQPFFNRGHQPGSWKTQPTVLIGMVAIIGPKR